MAEMDRRNFLGGAGLLAGLAACGPRRDPYAVEKPPVATGRGARTGSEEFVLSTCGLCHAGCGIRVRVVDGRAVKIEGNSCSPVNRGGLCARGQAGLEILYHPDRVRGPMRRLGARGEDHWQAISWREAIAQMSSELQKLRQSGKPESLVLLDGEDTGTTHALWARFLAAFGSPNHIGHGATGFGALVTSMHEMTGKAELPGYDFERARCVLLVGSGSLESSPQFIHLARSLAGESRPRLLLASPRLPRSAALIDEWLALAPGSEAPFVLGLVHVLLREQLVDESTVERAKGFAASAGGGTSPGFRDRVMTEFSPDLAARWTGISAQRSESLARELVATRPSVVVADEAMSDGAAAAAVLVLNALLGNLDGEGGMLVGRGLDLTGLGATAGDEIARAGLSAPRIDGRDASESSVHSSRILALPEAFLTGKPYPAKVLLLHYSNPIFSKPGGRRWVESIARVPFVVSFSPVLDESVRFADLVLPDHTFLERWDVVSPGRGTRALSIRQPVVHPLTDSMQSGEVILRLAATLGGTIADAFPWQSYRRVVEVGLAGFMGGDDAVLAELENTGTWVDSELVRNAPSLLDVTGAVPRLPPAFAADPVRFPLVLVPFRDPGYAEGGSRDMAWLAELPLGAGDPWQERVEMSPEDARALGVEDGDRVGVESPTARVEMWAEVQAGIKPGVLGLRLGGAGSSGPAASNLLADAVDASSGLWLACATRARVEKIA